MTTKMITMPQAELDAMVARLEELEDVVAAYEGLVSGSALPHEFMMQIIEDDEHPIKIWREYRGMKQSELSAASGVSEACISGIEGRRQLGTIEEFKALADALDTTIDALTV